MKQPFTFKPSRRYKNTCRLLQRYLQESILSFEWLGPSKRSELLLIVNDITVVNGTIDILWEIACIICELMVDHHIDDNTFHTFVTNCFMIREWGDC